MPLNPINLKKMAPSIPFLLLETVALTALKSVITHRVLLLKIPTMLSGVCNLSGRSSLNLSLPTLTRITPAPLLPEMPGIMSGLWRAHR